MVYSKDALLDLFMREIRRYRQTSENGLLSYGKLCSRLICMRWMTVCSCLSSLTELIFQEDRILKKAKFLIFNGGAPSSDALHTLRTQALHVIESSTSLFTIGHKRFSSKLGTFVVDG